MGLTIGDIIDKKAMPIIRELMIEGFESVSNNIIEKHGEFLNLFYEANGNVIHFNIKDIKKVLENVTWETINSGYGFSIQLETCEENYTIFEFIPGTLENINWYKPKGIITEAFENTNAFNEVNTQY